VCAVAWGNTIKGLIDAMPRQPKPRKGLTFVPVSGEPFNVANVDFSPTRAARRLAEAFQAEPNNTCSLAGIAARIPKELDQHSAIIKLFLNSSNDYKRIFGDSNPLCEQLDVIITGIGDVATSRDDPWFQETKELEGQEDLAKIAAGNIGGIWIPKESATKTERNQLHDLNRRWLGVREEDYRKCAERAEAGECPGVVVVAIEKEKAGIVAKAMGLINHVIIDRGLAEALLQYN
jgi:DNA-binding transcriptional regulator LsrR (DeoR family)